MRFSSRLGLLGWPLIAAFAMQSCKTRPDSAALRSVDDGSLRPTVASGAAVPVAATRVENESPTFHVEAPDVGLYASYSGIVPSGQGLDEGRRFHHLTIGLKALDMIDKARTTVVVSAFLLDCMYGPPSATAASDDDPERKITELVTAKLLAAKAAHPAMHIAVVLDPINRAYLDRLSKSVAQFTAAGIDVFYSDLAETPAVSAHSPNAALAQAMNALQAAHRADWHVDGHEKALYAALETVFKLTPPAALEEQLAAKGLKLDAVEPMLKGVVTAMEKGETPTLGGRQLQLDGVNFTPELVFNIALLKANHRKLLVTDDGAGDYEALVSSANPHDGSFGAANYALSARGNVARYVYHTIREDIRTSIARDAAARKDAATPVLADRFGKRFAIWAGPRATDPAAQAAYLQQELPELAAAPEPANAPVALTFVTESKIQTAVLRLLDGVQAGDTVNIQMFYLSFPKVIDAVLKAARIATVHLIMDPNKDAFNAIKDGTPNRQVARRMMRDKGDDSHLQIKWYVTHGEQNHAKIMGVTNDATKKYQLITGSGNWTGKNINGPNMESDLVVEGAPALNAQFNETFAMLWENRVPKDLTGADKVLFTVPYGDPLDPFSPNTAADAKWESGEQDGLVAW